MKPFDKNATQTIWKAPALAGYPQVYVTPLVVIGLKLRLMCFRRQPTIH